jgi:hypothetical protein
VDLSAGLLAVLDLGAEKAVESWLAGSRFLTGARERMESPLASVVGPLAQVTGTW